MRIAIVAPLVTTIRQPYVGGAQAMLADLAQGMQGRGHEVTLFARKPSYVPGVTIEQLAVPASVLPAQFAEPERERPVDSGFFAQANLFLSLFLRLQRQRQFDVIHAHAFDWPAYVASVLMQHLPVVHTIHLPAVSPEINAVLQTLHEGGHPLTLVTVSHACAATYRDYTPFDAVIYNGLDSAAIPFSVRVEHDAPLLYAGRISPEKGVHAAIEIAQKAGRPLLLAGGIYDQHYYETRIHPLVQQTERRITYLGQLEHAELWRVMGQCCGLLFPIEWDEPFGLVPVEAMASGTPVIAYRRGAASEIIRHGETGFLVEPGARDAAASRVAELAGLSRLACRHHVEQHFSLGGMLDAYEQVYHTLS